MPNYLHGTETVEISSGVTPIQVVRTAVIGLVGTAPLGEKNKLILVTNEEDAAKLGPRINGFTIPKALKAIFAQGSATVLVVNVFDNTSHITAVTDELVTITNRKAKLAFAHVGSIAPVVTNNAGTTTYVVNTDYKIDEFGAITVLASIATIAEAAVLKVSYQKLNEASFTAALINGSIGAAGERSGFKCFVDAMSTYKFKPKILIAPGFSTLNAVASNMVIEASNYRGSALIDAPLGTTKANAILGRGVAGTINFNIYNRRPELLYPYLSVYNDVTNANELQPYSQFMAGVISETHNKFGYWFSSSNKPIKGISGTETPISWAANDATTDANKLNEAGITTVGNGLSTWGNRNSSFPENQTVSSFNSVQAVADILDESVELAAISLIDLPVNKAWIDSVKNSVNLFINTLIGRGALIIGSKCYIDLAKNPIAKLQLGQVVFSIRMMTPIPAERITFEREIDVNLLKNLF